MPLSDEGFARLEAWGKEYGKDYHDAAAEIRALRAANARLTEALKPIAILAELYMGTGYDGLEALAYIQVVHLRAARAALEVTE